MWPIEGETNMAAHIVANSCHLQQAVWMLRYDSLINITPFEIYKQTTGQVRAVAVVWNKLHYKGHKKAFSVRITNS